MSELQVAEAGLPRKLHRMARTYSVGELLTLRDTLPFVICNIKKLNPKITPDVIKIPNYARLVSKRSVCSSGDLSSTMRKSVSRSSHTPGFSRDSERSHFEVKNGPWSPEDHEEVILFRGNLSLQSHEQKQMWTLRKRGSSDRSSQPFPAPSGFEAQKADNFRKFYAAVISPTHLRVTAGGRIVPNTRGISHPTFTWNAEKHLFESKDRTFGPESERQKSWLPDANLNTPDPHSPSDIVRPTVEEFFGPPLHMNSSAWSAAPTEKNDVHCLGTAVPDFSEEAGTEDVFSPTEGDDTIIQSQIKISPPGQFDIFRPFFINGQSFYPAPPGIQVPANVPILPFNMLGSLNTSYQSLIAPYGMIQPTPLHVPTGNFSSPQQLALDSQQLGQQISFMQTSGFPPSMVPQLHASVGQPSTTTPMMPAACLPDESIAMHPQAGMMINQMQALQQQLRHLENQLQNNKHQIDEQHVIFQQNYVQTQLRALQSSLNAQVFQPALLPHEQYVSPMWNVGVGAMSAPLVPITNSGIIAGKADALDTTPVYLDNFQTNDQDKNVVENKKASIGAPTPINDDLRGSQSSVPPVQTSRKRLSAAAAMAPEFQPRSQLTVANQSSVMSPELPVTIASGESTVIKHIDSRKKAEDQVVPSNVTSWSAPGQWANSNLTHSPGTMPKNYTMRHLTKGNPFTRPSADNQTKITLNIPDAIRQMSLPAPNAVDPYLMGYPPPGMPANRVKSVDMIYSRDLTREELQARQLYWGKAPRGLSKGLPKFDGKDFYAPSPEKASAGLKKHHSHRNDRLSQHSHTSCTIPDHNSPKSVRSRVTLPSRHGSKDSRDLFESADDFEQPTYKPLTADASSSLENDTASLDAWGMAQTDEEEIFGQPEYLTPGVHSRESNFDGPDSVKLKPSVTRRANGRPAQPSFLQDMLRHTPRTVTAAPTGALSSTIAHGYLPQYSGFAAASLAPSVSNFGFSALGHKNGRTGCSGRHSSGRSENQPLQHNFPNGDLVSAAEYPAEAKGKEEETIEHGFNPNTKGVGPVYGGSDW